MPRHGRIHKFYCGPRVCSSEEPIAAAQENDLVEVIFGAMGVWNMLRLVLPKDTAVRSRVQTYFLRI